MLRRLLLRTIHLLLLLLLVAMYHLLLVELLSALLNVRPCCFTHLHFPLYNSHFLDKEEDEGVTVRVSNLAESVNERTLRDLFSACGYCLRVRLPIDHETRKSRGFGFITYGSK